MFELFFLLFHAVKFLFHNEILHFIFLLNLFLYSFSYLLLKIIELVKLLASELPPLDLLTQLQQHLLLLFIIFSQTDIFLLQNIDLQLQFANTRATQPTSQILRTMHMTMMIHRIIPASFIHLWSIVY